MDLDEGLAVSSNAVTTITVSRRRRRMVFPQAVNSSNSLVSKDTKEDVFTESLYS